MNKLIIYTLLAITAPAALAANTLDLKVSGNISPVACDITIGNDGVIDYGNISPDILNATTVTKLDVKELPLQIKCDAPIKVALKTVSRRPNTGFGGGASTDGNNYFPEAAILGHDYFHGLGLSNNRKIGGYIIITDWANTQVDGQQAYTLTQHPSSSKWYNEKRGTLFTYSSVLQSWSDIDSPEPRPFKILNTALKVQAYIGYKNKLDISKPIKLDGASAIEIVYI